MSRARNDHLGGNARFVAGILCAGLMFCLVLALWMGWSRWGFYSETIDSAEPRIARLQGLLAAQEKLAEALQSARAVMGSYAYTAELDQAKAESDFQGRVRKVFEEAELTVSGTQAVPTKSLGDYEELGLTISAQGSTEKLQKALQGLRALSPRVRVDGLKLQPQVSSREPNQAGVQEVRIQINVIALRLRGNG